MSRVLELNKTKGRPSTSAGRPQECVTPLTYLNQPLGRLVHLLHLSTQEIGYQLVVDSDFYVTGSMLHTPFSQH